MRRVAWLTGAWLSLSYMGGCLQIADIEERTYDPESKSDGGAGDGGQGDAAGPVDHPSPDECTEYCNLVGESCTKDNMIAAYRSDEYCQAVCPHLVKTGRASDDEGNSFECRLAEANEAKRLIADPSEATTNCLAAGPGGHGKCGSNCEGYCQLYAEICSAFSPDPECLEHCPALRDDPSADAEFSFTAGDTLGCRLSHLAAAGVDPDTHCPHAQFDPPYETPCKPSVPSCEDYCGMLMNTCKTPDVQQYDSINDCLRTCNGFEKGVAPDIDLDTLACRKYHIYNSVRNPEGHCSHTGPGGDGHCGFICPAYCKLVKAACATGYDLAFLGGDRECESKCAEEFFTATTPVKDQRDLGYSVMLGKQNANTIQCRLYHAAKAFGNASAECDSALGLLTGDCK